ncbi:coenzyme F420-0:L-glutamate ligase [Chloroflexota bacterium]
MALKLTPVSGIPIIHSGDNLVEIIQDALEFTGLTLLDNDIIVVAQKIISKAEGRTVKLSQVVPSIRALEMAEVIEKDPRLVELILGESSQVLRARPGTIIVKHQLGFICANAGIDHSNVSGDCDEIENWVLLLPENPDDSANKLREGLEKASGVRLGVQVIDSHGRAWRLGTVGITIGLSGFPGTVDMRGKPDLFDYNLQTTEVGVADELAAGASLMMGQAAEGTPVIHARGFPYNLREASLDEILRPQELDLFQ